MIPMLAPDRFARHLVAVTAVITFAGTAGTASAAFDVQAGAFVVRFAEAGDVDTNVLGGGTIAAADIQSFSTAEQAAVVRAFEYWTDTLGLTPAATVDDRPIIRVVLDGGATSSNAFASSVQNVAAVDGFVGDDLQTTNTYARLLNSGAAADPARIDGIDGVIVFEPAGVTTDTERVTQLSNGLYSFEGIAIHELGHILGFTSGNDPFAGQVEEGPSPFDGTLNINLFSGDGVVEIDGNGDGDFVDPEDRTATAATNNAAQTIFGSDVPTEGGPFFSHLLIQNHNLTRARIENGSGFGADFRNLEAFGPIELAVMADMGYFNFNAASELDRLFGAAAYADNPAPINSVAATTNQDYYYGIFAQGGNSMITQNNTLTASGFAATGIRVSGRGDDGSLGVFLDFQNGATATDGSLVTIDTTGVLNMTGDFGIGVLFSMGQDHELTHRGTINASGTGGRAVVIAFGPSSISGLTDGADDITSENLGDVLVDQAHLSGTLIGDTTALFIGEGAGVGSVNLLSGVSITGDFVSNALVTGLFDAPDLTFGFADDGSGVTDFTATDAAFAFDSTVFDDDIFGAAGSRFDGRYVDGSVTFLNAAQFSDFFVEKSNLTLTIDNAGGATAGDAVFVADSFTATTDALTNAAITDVTVVNTGSFSGGVMTAGDSFLVDNDGIFTATSLQAGTLFTLDNDSFAFIQAANLGNTAVIDNDGVYSGLSFVAADDLMIANDGIFSVTDIVAGDNADVLNAATATFTSSQFTVGDNAVFNNAGSMTPGDVFAGNVFTITNTGQFLGGVDDGIVAGDDFLFDNDGTVSYGFVTAGTTARFENTGGSTAIFTDISVGNFAVLDNDGTFSAASFTALADADFDIDGTTTITAVNVGASADFFIDALFTTGTIVAGNNADFFVNNAFVNTVSITTGDAANFDVNAAFSAGAITTGASAVFDVDAAFAAGAMTTGTGTLFDIDAAFQAASINAGANNTFDVATGQTANVLGDATFASGSDIDVAGTFAVANTLAVNGGAVDVVTGGVLTAAEANFLAGSNVDVDGTASFGTGRFFAGSRLSGTGVVGSSNPGGTLVSGTVAPGNGTAGDIGTLGFAGDFTATDTTVFEFDVSPDGNTPAVDNDVINVSGAATVAGSVAVNAVNGGTFAVSTVYQVFNAGPTTSLFGLAPVVTDNVAGVRFAVIEDGFGFSLVVARDDPTLLPAATTENEGAGAIIQDVDPFNPLLLPFRDLFDTAPDPAAISDSLRSLTGEFYASYLSAELLAVDAAFDRVGLLVDPLGGCAFGVGTGRKAQVRGFNTNYAGGGFVSSDGNASRMTTDTAGTIVGLAIGIGERTEVGTFVNIETLRAQVADLGGSGQADAYRVGGFFSTVFGPTYLRSTTIAGESSLDASRAVRLLDTTVAAPSTEFSGQNISSDLEVGFAAGYRGLTIRPFAGLRGMHVEHESLIEEGPFGLALSERDIDSFRGRYGARLRLCLPTGEVLLDVFKSHEFIDEGTDGEAAGSVATLNSPSVTASGVDLGDNRVVISPAVRLTRGGVNLFGRYRLSANDESTLQSGEGGVEVVW
ncbi:MAG: autotransporter domain-containing protein [Planctomycetota bacterium]